MRCSIALFAFIASFVMAAAGFAQADAPKGLFLVTDYPAQTVRAGEIATIRVKLTNAGLPPEPVALSLAGVPAGWKVDILGGGQPVASAMPGVNQDVALQLRVDVPKDAQPGSQKIALSAKGPLTQAPDLVFTLTVGTEAPAKLSLKSRLPSLRGTPRSAFEYTVTVGNDSGKDLTVALSAQSPANFQTTFSEGFGSNEISSIPIEAGQTKDIKVKVTPPRDVKAGDFPVLVKVASEGATAELRLTLQVTGQGKLALSTKDGRLSGEAEVGKSAAYTLVVEQRRHRADRGSRDVGHRAGQLEGRVQPQDHRQRGAQREEGSAGPGDAGRQGDRRRLCRLVPRQRPRRIGVVRLPHHRHDLDPVGRRRHRHHRHCPARPAGRGRALRPAISRSQWSTTSSRRAGS